ncbi:hypothetical protein G6F51_014172 [Rhizopus arrhizus]|uniref:Uncharacterized protein n=1 Tax=Rhizopus oryzae TaxID=64495 RepID=A0A9P6XNF3_RHIOR|nr:hypothetical protein G6F51_014172 [Rhizopus arrhizus]
MAFGGHRQRQGGIGLDIGIVAQALVTQRVVPDLPGTFPRGPVQRGGGQEEGAVGDAGIDVHAAVVARRVGVIAHVPGLRILAQQRVVVGATGLGHGAQPAGTDFFGEQSGAHQPVRLSGRLAQRVLLDQADRLRYR